MRAGSIGEIGLWLFDLCLERPDGCKHRSSNNRRD